MISKNTPRLDVEQYFGDERGDAAHKLAKLILSIDRHVGKFKNPGMPFLKGDYKQSYYEYLQECQLNSEPISPEDALKYIAPMFQNIPIWNHPGTMINVIPPVNLAGLASASFASIYNPNLVQDTFSGLLVSAEMEVVKYLSQLAGWDWQRSYGLFTFGGVGTNLYPARIALAKAHPKGGEEGYEKGKFFMVTSAKAHPCHREIYSWIGIGSNNCILIPCASDDRMDLIQAEIIIRKRIEAGQVFVGFNMNCGSTAEYTVDPIREVVYLRDRLARDYNLSYKPHIHVDSVVGWVWLFYGSYDFDENPLDLGKDAIPKLKSMHDKVSAIKMVDSFGADFHKTGFCPYTSSVFMIKECEDLFLLSKKKPTKIQDLHFGSYCPFENSFEYSRPATGPLSALVTLKCLGIKGYQQLIGTLVESTLEFRIALAACRSIRIINPETEGLATLFVVLPQRLSKLTMREIENLNEGDFDDIRGYNISFAAYVLSGNICGETKFTLTSSRSYELPGTSIRLGAIKAYPMSVYLSKKEAILLAEEIISVVFKFENDGGHLASLPDAESPLDPTWH